jgi:hypothetical protein
VHAAQFCFFLPWGQGLHSTRAFLLAVRAGVAVLAVAFHLAVRAGVAVRAVAFQLPVRAGVARRTVLFHVTVGTRVTLLALVFPLAVRAPLLSSHYSPPRALASALREPQDRSRSLR